MKGKKIVCLAVSMIMATSWLGACTQDDACEHEYEWYVAKQVACTENGLLEGTCKKCGEKSMEVLKSVGHLFSNGVCTVCGALEGDSSDSSDSSDFSDEATELDAWTFEKLYEESKRMGFSGTQEDYKQYLRFLEIEEVYTGAIGQLCVTLRGGQNSYSLMIPSVCTDYTYTATSGSTSVVGKVRIMYDGMLEIVYKHGTCIRYGYIGAYVDKSVPYYKHLVTIEGVAVNKQNELLFALSDGSVDRAGIIANDNTAVSTNTLIYQRQGNEYMVVGAYSEGLTELRVPATHMGLSVTEIAGGAFQNCTSLKMISFENSNIKTIGYYAFHGCTSLENVQFQGSLVERIRPYAFADCAALQSITLPEGCVCDKNVFANSPCE